MQVLLEGARWQMIPSYALLAVFFMIWLSGVFVARRMHIGRLVAGLGVGLETFVLAVSIALPIALPVFRFPKPTGPYAVGSVTYHWVDTGRPELFTLDSTDRRELVAQVWYPARKESSAPRVPCRIPYMEDADATTTAMARIVHLPSFLFAHFKYVTTNAVDHAPAADDQSSYPVLIFFTGLGGFRGSNTFQVEGLVSHGYVVVGLDRAGRFRGSALAGRPRSDHPATGADTGSHRAEYQPETGCSRPEWPDSPERNHSLLCPGRQLRDKSAH